MYGVGKNVVVLFAFILLLSGFVFSQAVVPIKGVVDKNDLNVNVGPDAETLSIISTVLNIENTSDFNIENLEERLLSNVNNVEFVKCLSSDLKSNLINLYSRYKEAKEKGDEIVIEQIKKEALDLEEKIKSEIKECIGADRVIKQQEGLKETTTVAICDIPIELRNELNLAWKEYERIVSNMGPTIAFVDPKITEVKQRIEKIQEKIRTIKENCINSTQAQISTSEVPAITKGVGTWAMQNDTCVVPVELTQTYEGLMKQYNQAVAVNDTQAAEKLIEKIKEIKDKIEATKGQCVKTIVTTKAIEIKDVIEKYKENLEEIKNITNVEERNQLRQEIHAETKEMIKEIAKEKKIIDTTSVSELISNIQIRKDGVRLDEEEINTTDFAVTTKIRNRIVNITKIKDNIAMKLGNETGLLIPIPGVIKIINNTITVDDLPINVAPDEITEKAKMKIKEMKVEKENNTLVYSISGEEDRKFLGIFAIKVEKRIKASAETGQIIKEELPWWSFLTTKVE